MIHPQTAFLTIGLLYVILPITTWSVLHRRHDRQSLVLWCAGSLLYGAGFLIVGLRGLIPLWLSIVLAAPAALASYVIRGAALQRELWRPIRVAGAMWAAVAMSLAFIGVFAISTIDAPRLLINLSGNIAGALWLGWLSWQLFGQQGFRSAAALAVAFGLFAFTLVLRVAIMLFHWQSTTALNPSWDWILSFVAGLVAVLYGNLAYVGIALEASQRRELRRTAELAREHEQHTQSERRVSEQAALLAERDAMLSERTELLTALAHEVRQPLNNASAALQSAGRAIASHANANPDALNRLQRASSVLNQVASALDNTLSDAVLLDGKNPIVCQETDLDFLMELAIHDIDQPSRWRVERSRSPHVRTAVLHPGLLRLALRNLLTNALTYSPADSVVRLHVDESDESKSVVFEVIDQGEGISAELMPRLFERGVRGNHRSNPFGHGLGLYIVKRTADLHEGQVLLQHQAPHGLSVGLIIPQGQPV